MSFSKPLWQFQFPIIEFDGETFRILLTYLHCGSCTLSCLNIPGLICAAEHYDLPELLQACFHHAKQFIRVDKVSHLVLFSSKYWKKFYSLACNCVYSRLQVKSERIAFSVQGLWLSKLFVDGSTETNMVSVVCFIWVEYEKQTFADLYIYWHWLIVRKYT